MGLWDTVQNIVDWAKEHPRKVMAITGGACLCGIGAGNLTTEMLIALGVAGALRFAPQVMVVVTTVLTESGIIASEIHKDELEKDNADLRTKNAGQKVEIDDYKSEIEEYKTRADQHLAQQAIQEETIHQNEVVIQWQQATLQSGRAARTGAQPQIVQQPAQSAAATENQFQRSATRHCSNLPSPGLSQG